MKLNLLAQITAGRNLSVIMVFWTLLLIAREGISVFYAAYLVGFTLGTYGFSAKKISFAIVSLFSAAVFFDLFVYANPHTAWVIVSSTMIFLYFSLATYSLSIGRSNPVTSPDS